MTSAAVPRPSKKTRVIAYVDGFNLYYGLKNACRDSDRLHLEWGGDPAECLGRSLYWLDVQAAVLRNMRTGADDCLAIKYFSAPRRIPEMVELPDPARFVESNERQRIFFEALRTRPLIDIVLGWYAEHPPFQCSGCGRRSYRFEEKMTDVNIATHLLCDAFEDRFDRALVVSADADLVPPIQAVKRMGREVIVCLPPGRKRAKALREAATYCKEWKIKSLRNKMLPDTIERDGLPPLTRPTRWGVPNGWVWAGDPPIARSAVDRRPLRDD